MKGDPHDLFSGLIRIHVLHHAAQEELFGLGLIEELQRHGYHLSPGTLYPMLPVPMLRTTSPHCSSR